jgi:hypothetical protein
LRKAGATLSNFPYSQFLSTLSRLAVAVIVARVI